MPGYITKRNSARFLIAGAVLMLSSGCASLGEKVEITGSGRSVPQIGDILADLESNDAAINSFQSRGVFVIISPDIDGKRKFRGNLKFERPQRLYVQGTKLGGAVIVFRMISVDEQFLMEFPGNKSESFYQIQGEDYEDVPFSVSPSDIAREMFLPEDWGNVKKRSIHIVSYNADSNIVTVEMTERRRIHRRIELLQVDTETPRWVIFRNIRFDEHENILAITELTEYSKIEGVVFPAKVDAYFPTEDTRMTFSMRNIRLNADIDPAVFDIMARARELNLDRRSGDVPRP